LERLHILFLKLKLCNARRSVMRIVLRSVLDQFVVEYVNRRVDNDVEVQRVFCAKTASTIPL